MVLAFNPAVNGISCFFHLALFAAPLAPGPAPGSPTLPDKKKPASGRPVTFVIPESLLPAFRPKVALAQFRPNEQGEHVSPT